MIVLWTVVLMLVSGAVGFTIAEGGSTAFLHFIWGLIAALAVQQIGLETRKAPQEEK